MHPPRTSEPGPIASTQQPVSPVSDSWVLCAIPGWPPGNSSRTPAWMQLLALPAVSGIRSTHPRVSFRPHGVGGPGCRSRLKRSPGHGSRSCHVCLCTARPAPVQPKDTPTDLMCGREAAVTSNGSGARPTRRGRDLPRVRRPRRRGASGEGSDLDVFGKPSYPLPGTGLDEAPGTHGSSQTPGRSTGLLPIRGRLAEGVVTRPVARASWPQGSHTLARGSPRCSA